MGNIVYSVSSKSDGPWQPSAMKKEIYQKGILQNKIIQDLEGQARVAIHELWRILSSVAETPSTPYSQFVAECVSLEFSEYFYDNNQDIKNRTVGGKFGKSDIKTRLITVLDYIAGMTDRYALRTLDKINLRSGSLRHTM